MTTAFPPPCTTSVPIYMKFEVSPTATFSCVSLCFITGMDSPVKAASCVSSSLSEITRASAGMRSPSMRMMMSPGTISRAGIWISLLSLMTRAFGATIFFRASIAFSALNFCTNPIIAFMKTITKITIASLNSPATIAIRAAAIKIITIKSVNSYKKYIHIGVFFFTLSSFAPYLFVRKIASFWLKPPSPVFSSLKISLIVLLCIFIDYPD